MKNVALHIYYNDAVVTLDPDDIATMVHKTADDDALFHPLDAKPYTAITLKDGATTSQNVGTAYVSETPDQIQELIS